MKKMQTRHHWRMRTTAFAVAAIGVGIGTGVGASIAVGTPVLQSQVHTKGTTNFSVNAKGQTYGSALGVATPPNLIAVYADNGQSGYVYQTQLNAATGANVTTPSQALAWDAESSTSRSIPVYASDGTRVIGTFTISGSGKNLTSPAGG